MSPVAKKATAEEKAHQLVRSKPKKDDTRTTLGSIETRRTIHNWSSSVPKVITIDDRIPYWQRPGRPPGIEHLGALGTVLDRSRSWGETLGGWKSNTFARCYMVTLHNILHMICSP